MNTLADITTIVNMRFCIERLGKNPWIVQIGWGGVWFQFAINRFERDRLARGPPPFRETYPYDGIRKGMAIGNDLSGARIR